MVVKKSEYQNQYKACTIKKHQAAYLENLNLRHQRRDREFLHTPICWEELSEGDEKVSSDCSDEEQPKLFKTQAEPETQYQSLAEILSDAKDKAEAVRKQKHLIRPSDYSNENTHKKQLNYSDVLTRVPEEDDQVTKEADYENQKSEKKHLDKSNSLGDFLDEENRKLNKKLALTYAITPEDDKRGASVDIDHSIKTAERLPKEDRQPLPTRRTKICRQKQSRGPEGLSEMKPSSQAFNSSEKIHNSASLRRHHHDSQPVESASSENFVPPLLYVPRVRRPDRQAHIPRTKSTPVSPDPPMKERPPFMTYGIGDREDNLATHRTHNVRSSVDVYPHALRAKTRRNEEQHRRQKDKVHRAHSAEILREKLSVGFAQNSCDWESEYRKQFHGYQPKDYEKAIASHAVIPRSSQVRAVNRGGCLLVHVD